MVLMLDVREKLYSMPSRAVSCNCKISLVLENMLRPLQANTLIHNGKAWHAEKRSRVPVKRI
eukprot:7573431-Prorocentrum_lima.AAC.1